MNKTIIIIALLAGVGVYYATRKENSTPADTTGTGTIPVPTVPEKSLSVTMLDGTTATFSTNEMVMYNEGKYKITALYRAMSAYADLTGANGQVIKQIKLINLKKI